uniref:Uncharacterized protein n=1 Tax=Bionectria ochroleuca TaxID=29856 RepID=A0A0B7KRR4_BIOOC
MYLTLMETIKAIFSFRTKGQDEEARKIREEQDHSYIHLNIADRAPCPGLNALANQGGADGGAAYGRHGGARFSEHPKANLA